MGKRVLVIVLLALLGLFAYVGYSSYDSRRAGVSGQVFTDDRTRLNGDKTRASSSGTSVTDSATKPEDTEPIVYPPAVTQGGAAPAAAPVTSTSPATAAAQVTQSQQAVPAAAPASDTISPNPPNGMAFAGSGRYQLYRQGNITWRLDTETGRSCVIFATDEEWKKPRVYKAGCGRT